MSARREPLPAALHVAPDLRVGVLDTPIAPDAVDMLKVALSEIDSGRAVFPVWGVEQVIDAETGEVTWRCRCGGLPRCKPGKHPVGHLAPRGFKDATKNPHRAIQWFTAEPNANVGVVTGAVSGFDVVDIDPKDGGSLEAWEARFGPHPGGKVRTGSGGWHLEFPHTSGVRDGKLKALGLRGIEIKADGGFVLAGGSLHISGTRYERVRAYDASCQPLPEQVSTHCQGKAKKVDSWASRAVEGIVADFRLTESGKDKALVIAAMKLASIAATGRIEEAQITTVLLPEALAKGIDQNEALRQIANGIEIGRRNPRHIPEFNAITNRSEACEVIERWFLGVSADPLLIGREGLVVKKILTGLYLDALRAGKVRFEESWRQVARSAGVATKTAFKHRDSELLRRHVNIPDKGSYGDDRAATWMLTPRDFTAIEGSGVSMRS